MHRLNRSATLSAMYEDTIIPYNIRRLNNLQAAGAHSDLSPRCQDGRSQVRAAHSCAGCVGLSLPREDETGDWCVKATRPLNDHPPPRSGETGPPPKRPSPSQRMLEAIATSLGRQASAISWRMWARRAPGARCAERACRGARTARRLHTLHRHRACSWRGGVR